jgi:hypothetical protein
MCTVALHVLIMWRRHINGICEDDDPEGKKKGHLDKMKGMRDSISNSILQRHKDKVTDQIERSKHFLSEDSEYFPEGRRDQFIYRGAKVCIRFSCMISVLTRILL